MKYFILFFSLNILSLSFAQQKDLIVTYSSQTTFDDPEGLDWFKRSKMPQAEMNKMIKNATNEIHEYKLKIHGQISFFEYQVKINNDQNRGGRMFFSLSPGSEWYVDLQDSIRMREIATMGKEYLVKDSLKRFNWKISRVQKKVFNIATRKATATLDSLEYTAWYAPSIPISHGPNAVNGLPGLIMEVDIYAPYKDGKPHYRFWVSQLETKESIQIQEPNKGEIVTIKEFEQEMKAARDRFREMRDNRVERE